MMKIEFWTIGKTHETYVKQGVDDFSKRINNYFKLEWLIIPNLKNAAQMDDREVKKREGELVLSRLQKDDYLIALDERGLQLSSDGLSVQIQNAANTSIKKMIFLIGGASGLDEAVLQRANFKWSLSKLVFPHQLVRLILAEQVYRACTILKNEKYHRY